MSNSELGTETGVDGGRLRLVGREVFRAFKYNPQALQIVEPTGDRRHRGVRVVPQLLYLCVSVLHGFWVLCNSGYDAAFLTCIPVPSREHWSKAHTVLLKVDPVMMTVADSASFEVHIHDLSLSYLRWC